MRLILAPAQTNPRKLFKKVDCVKNANNHSWIGGGQITLWIQKIRKILSIIRNEDLWQNANLAKCPAMWGATVSTVALPMMATEVAFETLATTD